MGGNLSQRQRQILEFIVKFTAEHDYPPTIREIGTNVGISSTSVVNYNLNKLEGMDLLTREREVSRGLSLNRGALAGAGVSAAAAPAPAPILKMENGRRSGRKESADRFSVPLLGYIAAGLPIGVEAVDAQNAEEYIEVASELLGARENLFALRVRGDSMIDASVLNGDIVILRHQTTANNGDMVAAWNVAREETTLKHFYQRGNRVELRPANPNYEPITLPADQVRINGKVVTVIRVYN
jgi:repressor LexA